MSTLSFTVPNVLIAPEGETADALGYSVGGAWTRLYNLPGRTGFTAHFIQLVRQIDELPIAKATFNLVYQSSDNTQPSARIIALSYAGSQPVWEDDWGTFTRDAYNPTNQTIDVTAKLLGLLSCGRDNPQIGLEVYGAGVLQQAKLAINYAIPDLRAALTALTAEVVALTALVGRVAVLEAAKADLYSRVEALELAPIPEHTTALAALADHAGAVDLALAALNLRLDALEAAPPSPPGPIPITVNLPPGGFTINLGT